MIETRQSQDCYGWGRGCHSSLNVEWSTGEKETPSVCLSANLTKTFQVPHFTNGGSPMNKQPIMQTTFFRERPGFKTLGITSDSSKVLGVQPPHGLHTVLDSYHVVVFSCSTNSSLIIRFSVRCSRSLHKFLGLVSGGDLLTHAISQNQFW